MAGGNSDRRRRPLRSLITTSLFVSSQSGLMPAAAITLPHFS
jgi:hypothetical protein